jgi:hypothetical protein
MKKIISSVMLATLATSAFAQTKTLEQRIEELELSKDLSWVKWGGSLETRYDYTNTERNKPYATTNTGGTGNAGAGTVNSYSKGSDHDAYFRLWANLNMEATPNDRLSFFGRLSAAKYMSVLGQDGSPSSAFSDLSDGQSPKSSAIFLERAFANYKITPSLTFTMGRLPTIDGPNKHVALNQQLSGNYPTLAYSAILDGFALTKSFAQPESNQVFRTKLIYTPLQTQNFSGRTSAQGGTTLRDAHGNRTQSSSNFYSFLGEYEKTNASYFRKNLTIFQWVHGDQNPFYTAPVVANANATIASTLRTSVDRFVVYSEFEKIFHSEFDFAVQAMYSQVRSRGDITDCSGSACGTFNPSTQGWNTNKKSDNVSGTATAVTLRYQTPFAAINRPKIGVEWFQASKKAYVYDAANINPINMYATQGGDVYHAFWNQQFDGGLSMNIGYMYRKNKMTRELFGLLGKEVKTNNIDQNLYVSLLAVF